jgi:S-adenosylmethionine hydrolase
MSTTQITNNSFNTASLLHIKGHPVKGHPALPKKKNASLSFGHQVNSPIQPKSVYSPLTQSVLKVNALQPKIQFGAALYDGKYDGVKIITDYGVGKTEEISNNEVKDRFNRVLAFVTQNLKQNTQVLAGFAKAEPNPIQNTPGILNIDSISDIPGGNTDYVSLGLVRLGTTDPNQTIFIHVVDPGVGVVDNSHDRTILVTQDHGVYIGPNNGSLGLLSERLKQLGDTPKLYQIDFDQVEKLEQLRKNDFSYKIPKTIHGRDVFAVVGGALAAGLAPEAFALKNQQGQPIELTVVTPNHFKPQALPKVSGEEVTLTVLRDKTFGNLKVLNLPLQDGEFDNVLAERPQFEVKHPKTGNWIPVPVGTKFSDVPVGDIVLYHGSSPGIFKGSRGIEIALHLENASDALNIPENKAVPLVLRRV